MHFLEIGFEKERADHFAFEADFVKQDQAIFFKVRSFRFRFFVEASADTGTIKVMREEAAIPGVKGGSGNMFSAAERPEGFFGISFLVEGKGGAAAIADDFREGCEIVSHLLTVGEEFASDEAGGHKQQAESAGRHDNERKLALNRDMAKSKLNHARLILRHSKAANRFPSRRIPKIQPA